MSKEKNDLVMTPMNEHDILLMAMALVDLHFERPALKVEMFGVEFPTEQQREDALVPYQKRLIKSFG